MQGLEDGRQIKSTEGKIKLHNARFRRREANQVDRRQGKAIWVRLIKHIVKYTTHA